MENKSENNVSFGEKMIKAMKEIFSATEAPVEANAEVAETQEYKFMDMKLEDGVTIVSVDEDFVVDAILYIVDDSGRNPAQPGDYKLEDGRLIVVGEAGVIVEVKEPMMEEEEMAAAGPTLEERIKGLEDALTVLVEGMKASKKADGEKFSKLEAENAELKAEKEKLKNAPMVKPTVVAKFNEEKSNKEMSRLDRIQALRDSKENN